jgi:hypothetical protein
MIAVLNGSEIEVAIRPPQRNAAAKSRGDSRSRRSRNQRIASGSSDSSEDIASAFRKTCAASEPGPPTTRQITSAAKTSSTARTVATARATGLRCSGDESGGSVDVASRRRIS